MLEGTEHALDAVPILTTSIVGILRAFLFERGAIAGRSSETGSWKRL
jgi:hypothetical protein